MSFFFFFFFFTLLSTLDVPCFSIKTEPKFGVFLLLFLLRSFLLLLF